MTWMGIHVIKALYMTWIGNILKNNIYFFVNL